MYIKKETITEPYNQVKWERKMLFRKWIQRKPVQACFYISNCRRRRLKLTFDGNGIFTFARNYRKYKIKEAPISYLHLNSII